MTARRIAFEKWEGLGNDFVVVEAAEDAFSAEDARAMCDRHRGVGADGLLIVAPPRTPGAALRMIVWNADGSRPEMCGNGLRCVAMRHALRAGPPRADFAVETDAGVRACAVDGEIVRIDMGPVVVTGSLDIDLPGGRRRFERVDAGNPHAVAIGPWGADEIESVGPAVSTHAAFPGGTNVELAHVRDDRSIDVSVWERGAGRTLACGTGACAAVAAACAAGLAPRDRDVEVRLPGGGLRVRIEAGGRALIEGPARRVFGGEIDGTLASSCPRASA